MTYRAITQAELIALLESLTKIPTIKSVGVQPNQQAEEGNMNCPDTMGIDILVRYVMPKPVRLDTVTALKATFRGMRLPKDASFAFSIISAHVESESYSATTEEKLCLMCQLDMNTYSYTNLYRSFARIGISLEQTYGANWFGEPF